MNRMKYKLFSDDNAFQREHPVNATLATMSNCHGKMVGGVFKKSRFIKTAEKTVGYLNIKEYRLVGSTYSFSVKEVY